jgi:hypothetical protein
MAHKTLIGGKAYEISGGKTLIDGKTYKINGGKTLVGGKAYEVGFAVTLTIIVEKGYVCDLSHSEVTIPNDGGIFEVSPESKLTFKFKNDFTQDNIKYSVQKNGDTVFNEKLRYGESARYEYTVTKDATITINCLTNDDGTVTIIET